MKNIFNKKLNGAKNEQGFMFVAIILIVVVIFSITLVSGAEEFAFSPDDPGPTSPTANPSITISPSVSPPANSQNWSITYQFAACNGNVSTGNLTVKGASTGGYILTEIRFGSGNWEFSSNSAFSGGEQVIGLRLTPDPRGAFTWRTTAFSGGTLTNNRWSGGTSQTVYDGGIFNSNC